MKCTRLASEPKSTIADRRSVVTLSAVHEKGNSLSPSQFTSPKKVLDGSCIHATDPTSALRIQQSGVLSCAHSRASGNLDAVLRRPEAPNVTFTRLAPDSDLSLLPFSDHPRRVAPGAPISLLTLPLDFVLGIREEDEDGGGLHRPREKDEDGGLHRPREEDEDGGLHRPRVEDKDGSLYRPRMEDEDGGLHRPRPSLYHCVTNFSGVSSVRGRVHSLLVVATDGVAREFCARWMTKLDPRENHYLWRSRDGEWTYPTQIKLPSLSYSSQVFPHSVTLAIAGDIDIREAPISITDANRLQFDGQSPKCPACLRVFHDVSYLKQHYAATHLEHRFKCSDCAEEFRWEKSLVQHKRTAHQRSRVSCPECGQEFTRAATMNAHLTWAHRRGKQFACVHPKCGKQFASAQGLASHELVAHEDLRYYCELCAATFTEEKTLRIHKRGVHEGLRCDCMYCGRTFQSDKTLAAHIQKLHSFPDSESAEQNLVSQSTGQNHVSQFG